MKHATSVLIGLSLVSLTGCGRLFLPALFAAGATAAIVANTEPRVVVVEEVPVTMDGPAAFEDGPPQQPAPGVDPAVALAPPPVGLDPEAARAAIERVDIAACWVPGSTHGSGAARITFSPAGSVQLIELMNPVQGATVDSGCLAKKYSALRLPPFTGKPVVITGKIYIG